MEAWRQRRAKGKKLVQQNEPNLDLTPTGLLMEGVSTQMPAQGQMSVIGMLQRTKRLMRFGHSDKLAAWSNSDMGRCERAAVCLGCTSEYS